MRKHVILCLIILAAATQMFALGEARITAKVVDTEGKAVANAEVTIVSTARNTKQTVKTDKNGNFSVMILNAVHPQRFTVKASGYAVYEQEVQLKLLPEKNDMTFTIAKEGAVPATAAEAGGPAEDPGAVAYNEGVELYNAGKQAEAIAKFEEAIKLNPKLGAAYKTLTISYARNQNWAKTIEYGEQAVVYYGDDDEDLADVLMVAYEKTGQKDKAAQYSQKAPANPTVLFNQAAELINAGKDSEAEPLLKKATEADPKFAVAYYELGMLYARSSKNADARANLQKYLELEPNGKDAATAKEMLNYVK